MNARGLLSSAALACTALVVVVGSVGSVGCEEKKSAVEKRAEEMAKSNASSTAAASASAAAPDPAEQKFAAALKASRPRAEAYMTLYKDIETATGQKGDLDKFRGFFLPGPDGDKAFKDVTDGAVFAGKQGVPVVAFEIQSNDCDMKTSTCTIGVWEKQSQRGKFACYAFNLKLAIMGDQLYWKEKSIPVIVPCEQK
jgi:hypothetical protein